MMKLSTLYPIFLLFCIFPFVLSQLKVEKNLGTIIRVPDAVVTVGDKTNGCIPIDINLVSGIAGVHGEVCGPPANRMQVCLKVFGADVACAQGNLVDGVVINADAGAVSVYLKFYMTNNCLRLTYKVKMFWHTWSDDVQILCF
jgi:hypothetical protein